MKTRSKPPADSEPSQQSESRLPPRDPHPPKLFVVPQTLSHAASIVTLAHPRTLLPTRWFFCPETGIHEIKRFAAPPSARRSVLLSPSTIDTEVLKEQSDGELQRLAAEGSCMSVEDGYVFEKAELFTVTPVDPLFLVLPALSQQPSGTKSDPERALFLSSDDLFERLFEVSKHFQIVLRSDVVRDSLQMGLRTACDTVEAGDETMYRLNRDKLLQELVLKAKRIVTAGLPASLEQQFVTRPLKRPMNREDLEMEDTAPDGTVTPSEIIVEPVPSTAAAPQADDSTQDTTPTTPAKPATSIPFVTRSPVIVPRPAGPDIPHLLRLRVGIQMMLGSYVPPHIEESLVALLASPASPINFGPLDDHLTELAKARAAAKAARPASELSRQRGQPNDFEREEKKRQREELEEEERSRKKTEPRGLKELRKVNTTGMKKMSDFFKKA